jgi:hypothetical protein
MVLERFNPPGNVDDFASNAAALNAWSALISNAFDEAVENVNRRIGQGRSPFYNPTRVSTDAPVSEKVIGWIGFPKVLLNQFGANRVEAWRAAERLRNDQRGAFRPQDEYLEWHVTRNSGGKITRVDFTCEGPEYWQFLAERFPDKVLEVYKLHVSPSVSRADLFPGGVYNPRNVWNTEKGAMHLTHPANTLTAEIFIAGDATVLRKRANGTVITNADELIRCGQFGVAGRASDPRIGSDVNTLARQGFAITIKDPIGLYIAGINTTGWLNPAGGQIGNFFRTVRGTQGAGLRAVFEVPASEGFVVGDIRIGARNIEFGGQIAENINGGIVFKRPKR